MENFKLTKYERVPNALKYEPRWMAWISDRKIPVDPNTGKHGSSSDESKWSSFKDAINYGSI